MYSGVTTFGDAAGSQNFLTEPNSLTARINQIPYLRPQLHPQCCHTRIHSMALLIKSRTWISNFLTKPNSLTARINPIPYLRPKWSHSLPGHRKNIQKSKAKQSKKNVPSLLKSNLFVNVKNSLSAAKPGKSCRVILWPVFVRSTGKGHAGCTIFTTRAESNATLILNSQILSQNQPLYPYS